MAWMRVEVPSEGKRQGGFRRVTAQTQSMPRAVLVSPEFLSVLGR